MDRDWKSANSDYSNSMPAEERKRLEAEARKMIPELKKRVQSFITARVKPEPEEEFVGEQIERTVGKINIMTTDYAIFLARKTVEAVNNPKGMRVVCGVPEGEGVVNATLSIDPGDDFFDEHTTICTDGQDGRLEIIGDLGFIGIAVTRRPLVPSDINDYSALIERLESPDVSVTPTFFPADRRIPVNRH